MPADTWRLLIKTMHQSIQSVTVPSSASVLQLKDAIRLELDIANDRQRLIFQGRVLKDGTQLTDYSNLEDGKIIHLVARPADAPTNPINDEPPTTNGPRGNMPQMFPGMFGPSEGYTFITLDANISDLGGSSLPLSSLFGSMFGGSSERNGVMNGPMNTRTQFTFRRSPQTNQPARNNNDTPSRTSSPLDDRLNRRQPDEFSSLLYSTISSANSPSMESQLMRSAAALTDIQSFLDSSPTNTDISRFTPAATSSEASQTIRSQLRASGTSHMAQVGYQVNNMADLLNDISDRLRQVSEGLQAENASYDEMAPQLQHMVSSIGGLNVVNQFIGDIMVHLAPPATSRSGPRRSLRSLTRGRNQQTNSTGPATRSNTRRADSSSSTRSSATASSPPSTRRQTRSATSGNAAATASSSKKRNTRSTDSASSSTTGTATSSKRQKTNKTNAETGIASSSSAATKKGKGKRRADDN